MHCWKPQNAPRPLKHYFGDISVSPEGGIGTRATLATKMRKRLASPNNTRNVVEQRGISWCHGLSWKLAACTRILWDIEEYRVIVWNISLWGRSLHILEYHGVSNNLVEARGMRWYHGPPWKLTDCTEISQNIEKYYGIPWKMMMAWSALEARSIYRNIMEWCTSWYHAALN